MHTDVRVSGKGKMNLFSIAGKKKPFFFEVLLSLSEMLRLSRCDIHSTN